MKCGQRVTETEGRNGAGVEKALWAENSNSESAKSFSEENGEKRAVVFKSDRFAVSGATFSCVAGISGAPSAPGFLRPVLYARFPAFCTSLFCTPCTTR